MKYKVRWYNDGGSFPEWAGYEYSDDTYDTYGEAEYAADNYYNDDAEACVVEVDENGNILDD